MNQKSNDVQSVLLHQNRLFHVLRFSKLLGYEHDDCAKIAKELSAVYRSNMQDQHPVTTEYENIVEKVLEFAEAFAQKIEICLNDPQKFGVNIKWKLTQKEALTAIAQDVRRGLIRPACEIPTGIGKTLLEGALLRAYYEACLVKQLDCKMLVVTSRVIIADQMVNCNQGEDDLNVGDIALWFQDVNHPKLFSLMIGDHLVTKKRENDSLITIVSFQGLNEKRLMEICYEKIGFTMVDELHNRTERVSYYLSPINSYCVGMSGTVIGPDMRSPFEFFESTSSQDLMTDVFEYTKHLTYYAPLALCIERGELKPIRWYSTTTKIDIGEVQSNGGLFETFNTNSVEKLLIRDPYLMTKILEEIFLSDYPILEEAGSVHPAFRKTLAGGIPTIKLAKEYVRLYNERIVPKLLQKFGLDKSFGAAYVDGTMSNDAVHQTLQSLRNGEISIIFNCKKIGEGMNEPSIDMILPLGPFGFGSQSTLKQLIGRGLRLYFDNLKSDLLIFDNLFISKKHELTNIFGLLGVKPRYQGELLMAKIDKLNAEHRHLDFVMKGYTFEGAFANMTDAERELIIYTPGLYAGQKTYEQSDHQINDRSFLYTNLTIEEQFRIDIQHAIWENHDHVIQLAIQSLVRKRISLSLLEGYLSKDNFASFLKNNFVGFKNGKKMIQLVLKLRTEKITTNHLKKFIEVIIGYGFSVQRSQEVTTPRVFTPEISHHILKEINNEEKNITEKVKIVGNSLNIKAPEKVTELSDYLKSDNPIGDLSTFTLNNFGLEAKYDISERQYQNMPVFASIAHIMIFGKEIMSDVKVSRTIKTAKKCSAENLLHQLKLMVSSDKILSYESERFQKTLVRFNHIIQTQKLVIAYTHEPDGIMAEIKIGSEVIASQVWQFHHEKGAKAFALYELYNELNHRKLLEQAVPVASNDAIQKELPLFDKDVLIDNQSHIVKVYQDCHPKTAVRTCTLLVYKNGILHQIKGEGMSKDEAYINANKNIPSIRNSSRELRDIPNPVSAIHQLCQKHNFTVSYDSSPSGNGFMTTAKAVFKIDGKKFACIGSGKAIIKQSSKQIAVLDLLTRIHL